MLSQPPSSFLIQKCSLPLSSVELEEPLYNRWSDLCARAGQAGAISSGSSILARMHREPVRAYHNLSHVADCLEQLETVSTGASSRILIEFAIWWHDSIYDSRRNDNEVMSTAAWREFGFKEGFKNSDIKTVEELILCTEHKMPATVHSKQNLQDIDLSILGRDPGVFGKYEQQIREEYSWVDDAAFAKGRDEFLAKFERQHTIFLTDSFIKRYERTARENIARSRRQLAADRIC